MTGLPNVSGLWVLPVEPKKGEGRAARAVAGVLWMEPGATPVRNSSTSRASLRNSRADPHEHEVRFQSRGPTARESPARSVDDQFAADAGNLAWEKESPMHLGRGGLRLSGTQKRQSAAYRPVAEFLEDKTLLSTVQLGAGTTINLAGQTTTPPNGPQTIGGQLPFIADTTDLQRDDEQPDPGQPDDRPGSGHPRDRQRCSRRASASMWRLWAT